MGPDRKLPATLKVRHGRNSRGKLLHYYLNFSGDEQSFEYPYSAGSDLLTGNAVGSRQAVTIRPWDLVIVAAKVSR